MRPLFAPALSAFERVFASRVLFPTSILRELDDALVPLDDDVPGPGSQLTFS